MGNLSRSSCAALIAASLATGLAGAARAADRGAVSIDQGPEWNAVKRSTFYTLDQGSRIMPLTWFQGLRRADGSPFSADALARFGFLPASSGNRGLPLGFTTVGGPGAEILGMNCSACHTREIAAAGTWYRVDGAPAFVDFLSFLRELDACVGRLVIDSAAFDTFADAVLGTAATPDARSTLARSVAAWHERFHAWVSGSDPSVEWGPGRLDAVGMIINRVGGLGLGPADSRVIADNIAKADAPVRYPFLWNSSRQDRTQWLGFADNYHEELRLLRNAGQVLGVFGDFRPVRAAGSAIVDYTSSLQIAELRQLEKLSSDIGPPRFPGVIDPQLKRVGQDVFAQECARCHAERPSPIDATYWKTDVIAASEVGTDRRQLDLYRRTSLTGVLAGTDVPFPLTGVIKPREASLDLLRYAVLGSAFSSPMKRETLTGYFGDPKERVASLQDIYRAAPVFGYEARVLRGIWAAAPYLHNGSVPTLADLLKEPSDRPSAFKIGPYYDLQKVGLAGTQPGSTFTLTTTTDCAEPKSGNSRCGHTYGASRSEADKAALLEYLKSL